MLKDLYAAAAALVGGRTGEWIRRWRDGALAQAEATGEHLRALAAGQAGHLAESAVHRADAAPPPLRFGMCGRLQVWPRD
jgi:hypothetical protein